MSILPDGMAKNLVVPYAMVQSLRVFTPLAYLAEKHEVRTSQEVSSARFLGSPRSTACLTSKLRLGNRLPST